MASLDELWATLKPDAAGLVAAIVVHAEDGRVLMLGYMSQAALAATIDTRRVTFYSRSRECLWQKGESSGNTLALASIRIDCDADALLVEAHPRGPTCHTGTSSCFFKRVDLGAGDHPSQPWIEGEDDGPPSRPRTPPPSAIDELWQTILDRKAGRGITNTDGRSYVRSLLEKGIEKINGKIREEADELCEALARESDEGVANEAGDLLFHALVGLAAREVEPREVAAVLRKRHGLSGIDEKAAR